LNVGGGTRLVGILNVTPDSFFDGGRFAGLEAAVRQGRRMAEEGAAMIDIGGQSTRPGHEEISAGEEIARVGPVLESLAPTVSVPLSIDTYKPAVARAALAAGAQVLNDVRGFQGDPGMAAVAAEHGCAVILMHHDRGFPKAPGNTMEKIKRFFERSLTIAGEAGVAEERIILDPGIGFFKTQAQNLEILGQLGVLKSFGRPLLLGASRKSVIGKALGVTPEESLEGTLATTVLAVVQGVEFVRVHDVMANFRAVRMTEAILGAVGRA
jgi:dihydropteroate synthase